MKNQLEQLYAMIDAEITDSSFRAGEIQGGGYAWWCGICRTGQAAETKIPAVDQQTVGIGGLHHLLGPDHAARKVLNEDAPPAD